MDAGWAGAVAHRLHQSHPVKFKDRVGGGVIVIAECSTCPKTEEFYFNKRLPPEAVAKKLQRKNWDTRRRRCPKCVESGRKTRRAPYDEPPPPNALQDQIKRLFREPLEPLPQIQLGDHMDVKIGINDRKVSVIIPQKSKFIDAFMNDSFKAKAYWGIELVQASPQEEPLIRLYRTRPPADKVRAHGMVQGAYNSKEATFNISMAKNGVPGVDALGLFMVTEARLTKQEDDSFYFAMPKNRKPPIVRTLKSESSSGVVEMKKIIESAPTPAPALAPEAPITMESNSKPSTNSISLKSAIDLVNKYKDRYGDDLVLSITTNGKIRGTMEYGDHEV